MILVTELTDTQNEIQQQQMEAMANSGSFPSDNTLPNEHDIARHKINQSKKESNEMRKQLRALAGMLVIIYDSLQCEILVVYFDSYVLVHTMKW